MKEFITAVQDAEAVNEREAKIKALMADKGLSREDAESTVDLGDPIEFMLDGRKMTAYPLTPGQLAFMMSAMGRGQTKDARFASIISLILASLRDDDQDYLETRMLEKDPNKRLELAQVEEIFEYLIEEWFSHPTQGSSDSAPSPQSAG